MRAGAKAFTAVVYVVPVLVVVAAGCARHPHAPPLDPSLPASTSPEDRFDVVVPSNTRIIVTATRESPDDGWYRAVRYDRVAEDGTLLNTGRHELREGYLDVPPRPARSFLYIDAVHRAPGAAEQKSKLVWESLGENAWRLFFKDGHDAGRRDDLIITLRFSKSYEPPLAVKPGIAAPTTRRVAAGPAGRPSTQGAPAAVAWADATKPIQVGHVRLELTSASIVPAPGAAEVDPARWALSLTLKVENQSSSKRVQFQTWTGPNFPPRRDVITDNNGNTYRLLPSDPLSRPEGLNAFAPINPGSSLMSTLMFEPPVDGIQHLDLELPADNVGGQGVTRIRIPASMITKGAARSGTAVMTTRRDPPLTLSGRWWASGRAGAGV